VRLTPAPGRITALHLPGGPGVRVDSHLTEGYRIPASYDSLIAKLIVHGSNRKEALARTAAALADFRIEGCGSTVPLAQRLIADPAFAAGGVSIHYLDGLLNQEAEE
jgi:acetyl-CoA carboxylase biotin carboxylase subunit